MFLELADWILEVDVSLTMVISRAQAREHCTCGYCRNYYAAVDRAYPSVRPFLAKFGINVEGPDELCPYEPTIFEATYIVQGNIVRKGSQNLHIEGVPLIFNTCAESDICTEHPEPYFTITIGLLELPWLIDEPMSDVISPANEPEFIERMQRKLLLRLDNEQINS